MLLGIVNFEFKDGEMAVTSIGRVDGDGIQLRVVRSTPSHVLLVPHVTSLSEAKPSSCLLLLQEPGLLAVFRDVCILPYPFFDLLCYSAILLSFLFLPVTL
jgi:hypothetical protein